jgi:hypothetical protein
MINITLSNGSFIQWNSEQFTDYMYDGKCFIVIKESQWVGIYNLDFVRSIEVDK